MSLQSKHALLPIPILCLNLLLDMCDSLLHPRTSLPRSKTLMLTHEEILLHYSDLVTGNIDTTVEISLCSFPVQVI